MKYFIDNRKYNRLSWEIGASTLYTRRELTLDRMTMIFNDQWHKEGQMHVVLGI